jgi:hypothetical protein
MNLGLGPHEWLGVGIVGGYVGINSLRLLKEVPERALAARIENQI